MKSSVAIHKFASCDGCQLAFLNAGEDLLTLGELVDIVHFAEAGPIDPVAKVDIAFVEGSISTPDDLDRIKTIRANSAYLVTLGACATAGGIQALRNLADTDQWVAAVYPDPQYIYSLDTSTAIKEHVHVDLELWGCPVNGQQVFAAIRALLFGVAPVQNHDKICQQCKQAQLVCVLVSKGEPCMGPVTQTGCGALCPKFGRACYACFGPAENINPESFGNRLLGLGLMPEEIARRFLFINNGEKQFHEAGVRWQKIQT